MGFFDFFKDAGDNDLTAKAQALAPGSDGLIVQDHFQGNRTPYTDALSRGAVVGLTLAHEKHHLFRAIMEGISFGTRRILEAYDALGRRICGPYEVDRPSPDFDLLHSGGSCRSVAG